MTRVLDGEQTLMRIHIGEKDRHHRRPLYQVLVERLRVDGFAGATVIRGILGYGAKSVLHGTHFLRLSDDLPIVVEVIDSRERIDAFLPTLDALIPEGIVTIEKVRVILYRGARGPARDTKEPTGRE